MANVYEIVTGKILEALDRGEIPWRKPWGESGLPFNAVSKRHYNGINVMLLAMAPYTDPRWLSFKQVGTLGGRVRRGEHSTLVTFWKVEKYTPEPTANEPEPKEKKSFLLRYYNVFNVEQCDGLKIPTIEKRTVEPIGEAEKIVADMPSKPSISHNGADRAYYKVSDDSVHLPPQGAFKSPEGYYGTLFHELTHSTGHPKRLNRLENGALLSPFGSEDYSKEELVAEFGAAFLCASSGITNTVENSSAYIQSWMNALRNDKRLAVFAASQGQKAADYILSK